MKRVILSLLISCSLVPIAYAYSFNTKMDIEVISKRHENAKDYYRIEITGHDKVVEGAYPVGSIIDAYEGSSKGSDLINDAQTVVYIKSITLPNGEQSESSNSMIVLRGFSKIKSQVIPFYRLGKLAEGSSRQRPAVGKHYVLKKAKPNKTLFAIPN